MLPMIDDQLDDDRRHQLSQAQQQLHRQNPPQIPLTAQAQHANQALFLQQVARQQQTLYGGMPLQTIPPPASILQDINSQKALQKSSSKSRIRTHQVWTQQLDGLLRDCVNRMGESWYEVSLHLQNQILSFPDNGNYRLPTPEECSKRWKMINPDSKNYPPWNEDEKALLTKMVGEAQIGDTEVYSKCITIGKSGERVRTISWVQIAEKLKRSVDDVSHMWSQIRVARFKRGAFTEEEDRKILQRVQEWNALPPDQRPRSGLWVALEKEIGREDKRISERYRNILSKRQQPLHHLGHSSHSLQQPLTQQPSHMHHSQQSSQQSQQSQSQSQVPQSQSSQSSGQPMMHGLGLAVTHGSQMQQMQQMHQHQMQQLHSAMSHQNAMQSQMHGSILPSMHGHQNQHLSQHPSHGQSSSHLNPHQYQPHMNIQQLPQGMQVPMSLSQGQQIPLMQMQSLHPLGSNQLLTSAMLPLAQHPGIHHYNAHYSQPYFFMSQGMMPPNGMRENMHMTSERRADSMNDSSSELGKKRPLEEMNMPSIPMMNTSIPPPSHLMMPSSSMVPNASAAAAVNNNSNSNSSGNVTNGGGSIGSLINAQGLLELEDAQQSSKRARAASIDSQIWSDAMDAQLIQGVDFYGGQWGKVAELVNNVVGDKLPVDGQQCRLRYHRLTKRSLSEVGNDEEEDEDEDVPAEEIPMQPHEVPQDVQDSIAALHEGHGHDDLGDSSDVDSEDGSPSVSNFVSKAPSGGAHGNTSDEVYLANRGEGDQMFHAVAGAANIANQGHGYDSDGSDDNEAVEEISVMGQVPLPSMPPLSSPLPQLADDETSLTTAEIFGSLTNEQMKEMELKFEHNV